MLRAGEEPVVITAGAGAVDPHGGFPGAALIAHEHLAADIILEIDFEQGDLGFLQLIQGSFLFFRSPQVYLLSLVAATPEWCYTAAVIPYFPWCRQGRWFCGCPWFARRGRCQHIVMFRSKEDVPVLACYL